MVCSLSFAFFSSAPLFFFFFLMNFWEASFWNPWTQGGQRATCMRPQSCPTFCDHMDHSLPGSSVHGVLQVRILEWVAISYSRGSSWPRDRIHSLQHWQSCCLPLGHLGILRQIRMVSMVTHPQFSLGTMEFFSFSDRSCLNLPTSVWASQNPIHPPNMIYRYRYR